jgi:ABC-type branched-subunit amino acid transport system substrate-binding protein
LGLGALSISLLGALGASCSLGNVKHDACKTNDQCAALFGLGSKCEDGFCGDPPACKVSSDCRAFGYFAGCTAGHCQPTKLDPRCTVLGPQTLVDSVAAGKGTADAVLLGALFNLKATDADPPGKEDARAAAAELAVDEINEQGGTHPFGLVLCNYDNTTGDFADTVELARYLATDVGVPAIVGPSSTQATSDVATALYQTDQVPAVIISPAATGTQLTLQPDHVPKDAPQGLLWRSTVNDAVQAAFLSQKVSAAIQPTMQVGVLYVDEQYGSSFVDVLAASLGMNRLRTASFKSATDVNIAVGIIKTEPNLGAIVIVSNKVDAARAALDACAVEPALSGLKFFLTDGSKDPAIAANPTATVQPLLDGLRGTAPKNPTNQAFYDRLKQKSGFDPSQFSFVAQSYDATYLAAYGVVYAQNQSATFDGDGVAVGLSNLSSGSKVTFGPTSFKAGVTQLEFAGTIDVVGVSGELNLDSNGDVLPGPDDMDVWCVKNGAIANGVAQCP